MLANLTHELLQHVAPDWQPASAPLPLVLGAATEKTVYLTVRVLVLLLTCQRVENTWILKFSLNLVEFCSSGYIYLSWCLRLWLENLENNEYH